MDRQGGRRIRCLEAWHILLFIMPHDAHEWSLIREHLPEVLTGLVDLGLISAAAEKRLLQKVHKLGRSGKEALRALRDDFRERFDLMTEAEVAAFIQVNRDAVRKFRRQKIDPLPCGKPGRRYLYDREAVWRWATREAERTQARVNAPRQPAQRRPAAQGRVPPRGFVASCPPRRVGVPRERAGIAR